MEVVSKEALVLALQRAGARVALIPPTTAPEPDFLDDFAGPAAVLKPIQDILTAGVRVQRYIIVC